MDSRSEAALFSFAGIQIAIGMEIDFPASKLYPGLLIPIPSSGLIRISFVVAIENGVARMGGQKFFQGNPILIAVPRIKASRRIKEAQPARMGDLRVLVDETKQLAGKAAIIKIRTRSPSSSSETTIGGGDSGRSLPLALASTCARITSAIS